MTITEKVDKLQMMKQGTRVIYIPQFGDGIPQEAIFHRLQYKRGEYIVEVEIDNGSLRWGYIYQIALI